MLEIMRGWCDYELRDINDARERAAVCGISESEIRKGVQAIVLSKSLEASVEQAKRFINVDNGRNFILLKAGTEVSVEKPILTA